MRTYSINCFVAWKVLAVPTVTSPTKLTYPNYPECVDADQLTVRNESIFYCRVHVEVRKNFEYAEIPSKSFGTPRLDDGQSKPAFSRSDVTRHRNSGFCPRGSIHLA